MHRTDLLQVVGLGALASLSAANGRLWKVEGGGMKSTPPWRKRAN